MKKSSCISLTLALLLLTACTAKEAAPAPVSAPEISAAETTVSGEDTPSAAEPEPESKAEPKSISESVAEPIPEPEPESTPEPAPMPEPSGDRLEKALACVDQDISVLYAAIGEPESSRYEYSCSGPGEDGVLFYDGFLVFTYKENGVETVVDAEAES